jgi:hypothetical protein
MAEAYALRAEYEGTIKSTDDDENEVEVDKFRGASFALPDGRTFNIAERLKDGGGTIVTDDPLEITYLDDVRVLKKVAVPKRERKPANAPPTPAATEGKEA